MSERQGRLFRNARPASRGGDELLVDNFAGGGGASTGIELAMGRTVDIAINHNPLAVRMHALNHPYTRHLCEDVFKVDPLEATGGRHVGLAWFSPDCTHHSRAKGGKPRSRKIRGLAWVVVKWARLPLPVRPRVIILENVREFEEWGPLDADGMPDQARRGLTFARWVGQLRAAGYRVEWRVLNAADFGAPTHRRRLFLVARRDGLPIVWPEPTHGAGRPAAWRTAAECIDWSLPCPSIFSRKRPLAEATCRRIASGIVRYVMQAKEPFIVRCAHTHPDRWGKGEHSITEPIPTMCASKDFALCVPSLIGIDHRGSGDRPAWPAAAPLTTVTTENRHALVAAFLAKHYGGVVGHDLHRPIGTVTARDHHSVVAAHLTKFYGTSTGSECGQPVPTITGQGQHLGLVAAFLMKYYASGGQWSRCDEPLHTIVSKARMGLVTVSIDGQEYAIADIGLRMLEPRELARAQGFPDDYLLVGSKADQVAAIGNSVCPPIAAAIVRANMAAAESRVVA